jgi:hypothetical protein
LVQRFGVNAALLAQYIWNKVCENEFAGRYLFKEKFWMCSSQMMFTAVMPYLSRHSVRQALEQLIKQDVIVRSQLEKSPFDHTFWYAFTEFGALLMRESEDEEYQ